MRALIASLVFAFAVPACGGKDTTTTTTTVETTGGNGTTATPPDPDPKLVPKSDMTLAEAEAAVSRVVELMGILATSLAAAATDDCAQLVPAYQQWMTNNAEEQASLEDIGAKIPPAWSNGELVDYYLEMEEHEKTIQQSVVDCRCDSTVQSSFGLDASKFECP